MSGLVYSYLRFSDPRQSEGNSADRQTAYARQWAAERDMQLDQSLTMRDEGLSAYHQRHVTAGAFGVFLAAVEAGKVPTGSVLIIEDLDRISRAEPLVAMGQMTLIVNAGITLVTANDRTEYSRELIKKEPHRLFVSLSKMIRANEESETKSIRVTSAIVRLCKDWVAGTYRGKIRNGKDPQWLTETATGWELHPERAEALRMVVKLYLAGHSGQGISRRLGEVGASPLVGPINAGHFYKLIKNPNLLGTKRISVGGEDFELQNYYPAVISQDVWEELLAVGTSRGRRGSRSTIPHVITGLGITYCGYCGKAMSGQHLFGKIKVRGDKLKDGYRRLLCGAHQYGSDPCPYPASRSVAPVERALMTYCSDIINVRALYGADRAAPLREQLTGLRQRQAEAKTQSERLLEVLLSTPAGTNAPDMFTRKARELEAETVAVQRSIAHVEAQINSLARNDVDGINTKWAALAQGVQELDYDARLQARQLVADTFSRIVVYATGMRPEEENGFTDVVLIAKGGVSRMLRIDKKGNWQISEDVERDHVA